MDLCHCIEPDIRQDAKSGGLFCLKCRLWYDADAWKVDPRITEEHKRQQESKKRIDALVDKIISEGKPKK